MMFLRLYVLLIIFNQAVGLLTGPWFAILFIISLAMAYFIYRGNNSSEKPLIVSDNILEDKNPLEFKVAIIFASLYVFFSVITEYTLLHFGNQGLHVLSFVVGFTDIDPFLLNLFQGKYNVSALLIGIATFQAIASNNILKLIYGISLGHKRLTKYLAQGFGMIIIANIIVVVLMHVLG